MMATDIIFDAVASPRQAAQKLELEIRDAKKDFSEQKIYPRLSELVLMRSDIARINKNKDDLTRVFDLEPDSVDNPVLQDLLANNQITVDTLLQQLPEVIQFTAWAEKEITPCIKIGKDLHERAADQIFFNWNELGQVPHRGLLVIDTSSVNEAKPRVYTYRHQVKEVGSDSYWVLNTSARGEVMSGSAEHLTTAAINQLLPSDSNSHADGVVIGSVIGEYPFAETLFPVAKRRLLSQFVKQQKEKS